MCGICGKLNFDRDQPVSAELLRRMTQAIAHRGPDGDGHHLDGAVGLGHRRLSIIDLETGAQPMCNEDGTVWVVFNGEIYNFEALRRDLIARGHRFKSASDTEVIVHLYEQYGDACVEQLQGMFAFAVWDQRQRRLLLARDRVGIKPLYYANTGRALLFGSEIKALLADASVERELDFTAVDRFLTYYYVPGDLTLLRGVKKLPPGHTLTVEGDRVQIKRYWDLKFPASRAARTITESAEALDSLLSATVKSHMISDVPVGILLSGGVDSAGMLHYASQHANGPLHSFTMGFAGTNVPDERPFAQLAAQRLGSVHHETTLTSQMFRDFLPRYVWHMEEPVCEPPAIALHFVSQLARSEGVKVLLSGEGGDEAFAGYPEYRNLMALEALKSGSGPAKGLLNAGFGALQHAGWARAAHYRALLDHSLSEYYFSRTATPQTPFNLIKSRLYGPQLLEVLGRERAGQPTQLLLGAVEDQPLLNRMLYVDTKSWLPDDLLVKADKMTMAASVELRVPFLDHHVLEFAAGLPTGHKARGWSMKRVLKQVLASKVPKEILQRKKAGFPVPYESWLRGDLRDFIQDTVRAEHSFSRRYFNDAAVGELLGRQAAGLGASKETFSLLVLELWRQQFLTASPLPSDDQPAAPALGDAVAA